MCEGRSKVGSGTLTGQVHNAGDDDDRPPHQGHHGQHLGHAPQTHGSVQVPLLQAVLGLKETRGQVSGGWGVGGRPAVP